MSWILSVLVILLIGKILQLKKDNRRQKEAIRLGEEILKNIIEGNPALLPKKDDSD